MTSARGDASRPWLPALLFAVGMLGLALALVAALAGWRAERAKVEALSGEADSLRREVRDLRSTAKRSLNQALGSDRQAAELRDGLDAWTIQNLKRVGFADPVHDIKADLVKHPELIPDPPVLGGTMGFYGPGIRIVNSRWVVAPYEDGHVGGAMLLEYRLEGTRIHWKRIASYKE